MDEAQLEVTKEQVKFKMFGSIEEAQAFKDSSNKILSDISKVSEDKYYVAYCKAGELASEAVRLSGEYYNLNVPLTAGYIIGRNWAECH